MGVHITIADRHGNESKVETCRTCEHERAHRPADIEALRGLINHQDWEPEGKKRYLDMADILEKDSTLGVYFSW